MMACTLSWRSNSLHVQGTAFAASWVPTIWRLVSCCWGVTSAGTTAVEGETPLRWWQCLGEVGLNSIRSLAWGVFYIFLGGPNKAESITMILCRWWSSLLFACTTKTRTMKVKSRPNVDTGTLSAMSHCTTSIRGWYPLDVHVMVNGININVAVHGPSHFTDRLHDGRSRENIWCQPLIVPWFC